MCFRFLAMLNNTELPNPTGQNSKSSYIAALRVCFFLKKIETQPQDYDTIAGRRQNHFITISTYIIDSAMFYC